MESPDHESPELNLLHRGRARLLRALFSRMGLIVLLLLFQVAAIFLLWHLCAEYTPHIYAVVTVLSVVVVFYLLNSGIDPTAKITWLIVMLLVPVLGALLLLYAQLDVGHRAIKGLAVVAIDGTRGALEQDPATLAELERQSPETASLARYISRSGCYPVFADTETTYFPVGEDFFEALLPKLEDAEHFIFLEYFILAEGHMWGRVLDILARKARAGVEVRVIYDGTCEFTTLPRDYPKLLRDLGIQCQVFFPATPFLSTHYNYRDHRKILVIDGHTAFTGGINLADEYINRKERFGHWKDTAVMLRGEAVRSFTLMFLQLWDLTKKTRDYRPYLSFPTYPPKHTSGFVIPYADCPLDHDKVGERVYMDILNRAQHYVHIMSPYLILDGEMETALTFAAERGVDVALILPGIPDKKIPYALALTHYATLLKAGVRLYEYTPGFVHAKVFVSDDRKAVVGTINMDYRSFYHHFECAAYLYEANCIPDIERDFQATLAQCRPVTRESLQQAPVRRKLTGFLCKAIAPLL